MASSFAIHLQIEYCIEVEPLNLREVTAPMCSVQICQGGVLATYWREELLIEKAQDWLTTKQQLHDLALQQVRSVLSFQVALLGRIADCPACGLRESNSTDNSDAVVGTIHHQSMVDLILKLDLTKKGPLHKTIPSINLQVTWCVIVFIWGDSCCR